MSHIRGTKLPKRLDSKSSIVVRCDHTLRTECLPEMKVYAQGFVAVLREEGGRVGA